MIATLRKRAQITIPSEIINKLGLSEGDQLDVLEKDGAIMLLPMAFLYIDTSDRLFLLNRETYYCPVGMIGL